MSLSNIIFYLKLYYDVYYALLKIMTLENNVMKLRHKKTLFFMRICVTNWNILRRHFYLQWRHFSTVQHFGKIKWRHLLRTMTLFLRNLETQMTSFVNFAGSREYEMTSFLCIMTSFLNCTGLRENQVTSFNETNDVIFKKSWNENDVICHFCRFSGI